MFAKHSFASVSKIQMYIEAYLRLLSASVIKAEREMMHIWHEAGSISDTTKIHSSNSVMYCYFANSTNIAKKA